MPVHPSLAPSRPSGCASAALPPCAREPRSKARLRNTVLTASTKLVASALQPGWRLMRRSPDQTPRETPAGKMLLIGDGLELLAAAPVPLACMEGGGRWALQRGQRSDRSARRAETGTNGLVCMGGIKKSFVVKLRFFKHDPALAPAHRLPAVGGGRVDALASEPLPGIGPRSSALRPSLSHPLPYSTCPCIISISSHAGARTSAVGATRQKWLCPPAGPWQQTCCCPARNMIYGSHVLAKACAALLWLGSGAALWGLICSSSVAALREEGGRRVLGRDGVLNASSPIVQAPPSMVK